MSDARLSLNVGGLGPKPNRVDQRRPWKKKLDLSMAIKLIQAKEYPPELTAALIKKISTYPCSTYQKFLQDIGKHMNEIQRNKNI